MFLTNKTRLKIKDIIKRISADEKDLLAVSGVGINLVKKLKKLK